MDTLDRDKMSNWSIKQQLREEILEAVEKGDITKTVELLDKGADVNEGEGGYLSKKTVLIVAIENRHEDMARLLVDRGADLTITITVTGKKKTVVDMARDKELTSLADYIQYKTDLNERLISSIQDGRLQDVQGALGDGANVHMMFTSTDINQPDCTLLQLALIRGHLDVAKTLIQTGIDLHHIMKWEDQTEDTARSYAERMNYDAIVTLIDQRIQEQASQKPTLQNGNSQHHQNANMANNKQTTMEVYDIEDVEEVQEEPSAPIPQKQQKKAAGCTVS